MAAVLGLVFGVTAVASADLIRNALLRGDVDTIAPGGSTTVRFWNAANGGNCNVSAAEPGTLTINAPGTTADGTTAEIAGCGYDGGTSVTFGASAPGTYAVALTMTGGKAVGNNGWTYDHFTLQVIDPNRAPIVTVPSDITVDPDNVAGATVSFDVSAEDHEDGALDPVCTVPSEADRLVTSGSLFDFGTTTVSCTVIDSGGRGDTETFDVTVDDLGFDGFYSPLDNEGWNTIRGGNSVALKFNVSGAGGNFVDTAVVDGVGASRVACPDSTGTAPVDDVDFATTGGTSLRHADGQFIQNWQTPTGSGCYRVDLTLADGEVYSVKFQTRR